MRRGIQRRMTPPEAKHSFPELGFLTFRIPGCCKDSVIRTHDTPGALSLPAYPNVINVLAWEDCNPKRGPLLASQLERTMGVAQPQFMLRIGGE